MVLDGDSATAELVTRVGTGHSRKFFRHDGNKTLLFSVWCLLGFDHWGLWHFNFGWLWNRDLMHFWCRFQASFLVCP